MMEDRLSHQLMIALQKVLGKRLVAVVVHGSAAKGGYIKEFSDFDFYVFQQGALTLEDALALHQEASCIDPAPFSYLQASGFIDVDGINSPTAILIPGAYKLLYGKLPEGIFYSADQLKQSSQRFLEGLPALITQDMEDWAVATGAKRTRLVRLLFTRLLPAVRALLVVKGADPLAVWAAPLPQLITLLQSYAPDMATRLQTLIGNLPPSIERESEAGDEALLLLNTLRKSVP